MGSDDEYPRELAPQERALLLWVLPPDRPGFQIYRKAVEDMKVVGEGRRGSGTYILAPPNVLIDRDSPLPHVIAYGVVESTEAKVAVTVRKFLGEQMEFEIMNLSGVTVPTKFHETRRWTFSHWLPADACPICSQPPREVTVAVRGERRVVLAICQIDKRLWLYDSETGINHLIPVTNFYNELMIHRRIRDPQIALHPERLFTDLNRYSDRELVQAFHLYNQIRMKVPLEIVDPPATGRQSPIPPNIVNEENRR